MRKFKAWLVVDKNGKPARHPTAYPFRYTLFEFKDSVDGLESIQVEIRQVRKKKKKITYTYSGS